MLQNKLYVFFARLWNIKIRKLQNKLYVFFARLWNIKIRKFGWFTLPVEWRGRKELMID